MRQVPGRVGHGASRSWTREEGAGDFEASKLGIIGASNAGREEWQGMRRAAGRVVQDVRYAF